MLNPGTRVALIGDSHMEALGPRLVRLIPDQLGARVVNVEARRGWSTRAYLRSRDLPALAAGADVVVIELGGNDAAAQIGPEQHAEDVQAVIAAVAPAKVVWVGPGVTLRQDLESYRGPIRQAQRMVVEREGGAWIDSQPLTRAQDLRSDRIHFTAQGYDEWARKLVPKLASAKPGGEFPTWWIGPAIAGGAGLFALAAWAWSRR